MTAATQGMSAEDTATTLPRLLPRDGQRPEDWRAHTARHGRLPYRDRRGDLTGELEAAGLTGRGGAAFPVHRKLSAVLDAAGKRRRAPIVIANGAESEPASEKDATLLWLAPHLVLDGLQLAAEAVGAEQAILYTHVDRRNDVGRRLRQAIAERAAVGADRVAVQLAEAPPRFLSGQETALVSHLAGGPAIPSFMPPRITERGLLGAPTLVQNVETLAHVALIARHGPRWFRQTGTAAEPGSMLCTIRRADGTPRVVEVPLGMPLQSLLAGPGGRGLRTDQAVLIGGYHGSWLPAAEAVRLTLDNQSLGTAGARVGAGILLTPPPDRCGLIETAAAVRYLALESAGQCGPCLNGLPRMAAALTEIAVGRQRAQTQADVERWAGLVTGRGACHHPDGTVRFVRSALLTFAAEVSLHQRGQCTGRSKRPYLPIPHGAARTEEDWI